MACRRVIRMGVGEVLRFESRVYPKPLSAGVHCNPEFRCVTANSTVKIHEEFPAQASLNIAAVLAEIDCPWMLSPAAANRGAPVHLPKRICFEFTTPGSHRIIETRFSEETGRVVEEISHRVVVE